MHPHGVGTSHTGHGGVMLGKVLVMLGLHAKPRSARRGAWCAGRCAVVDELPSFPGEQRVGRASSRFPQEYGPCAMI